MERDLGMEFFTYVSRFKVQQLHEQLGAFTASEWSEKRALAGKGDLDAGASALFGFLKAGFKASGSKTVEIQKSGFQSPIQMLRDVLANIEAREKVLDLNELCKKKAGEPLDAFAYCYEGNFIAEAEFGSKHRSWREIVVHESALERSGEVVISKNFLIDPGRAENAFEEVGPNNGKLISDICVITSSCEGMKISLSCSYKYFSDMGGHWDERNKEWECKPHSGNHHFFSGGEQYWFKTMLFITGIRGNLIMGTPLFLVLGMDPNARI